MMMMMKYWYSKTDINTTWAKKRATLFWTSHNSHLSWIFTLLVPMKVGMNTLHRS